MSVPHLRCAAVVLPDRSGDARMTMRSLDAAFRAAPGDIAEFVPLPNADIRGGAEEAERAGCDWLFVVSAVEEAVPNLFAITAPALRLHDAVWGGAALATADDSEPKLERITRLAAADAPGFFHAALRWWIGPAHFVRPRLAAAAARRASEMPPSVAPAAYMAHLWRQTRAYKTAQCLTIFHEALPALSDEAREHLVADLAAKPVFMDVAHREVVVRLPYTGLNPVIEREQMRGLFFEADELAYLAGRLPHGMRIVDVGANTGNHTAFFAAAMEAEMVTPIEPEPRAAAAIRAMVAENRLGNVDLGALGIAVGEGELRLRPHFSATAGLGATSYVVDPTGPIRAAPLDALIEGHIDFIKIDVEGMEMEVLAGAQRLISRHRPALFVEVVDSQIGEFTAWTDANSYRFERLFPDKTHCNYLVLPVERSDGRRQAGGSGR